MEGVTIRLRTEDDDPQIIAIRNEANSHLPPTSVEEYRFNASAENAGDGGITERFVAERDGRILGLYVLVEMKFVNRPDTFAGNIGVASAARRRGLGETLYDHLIRRASAYGATRLYGEVADSNTDALEFLEHRGFKTNGRANRMSCLTVREADLGGYDGVAERVEAGGIAIKTLTDLGAENENLLRKVHRLSVDSARDIPTSEEFSEFPYERWHRGFLSSPGNSPDQIWIALDGDNPVGLAAVSRRGANSSFNNYTGVSKDYRGRGIARALKLKTIEWARATGVETMFTGNEVENHRMLSINIPLGYKAVPKQVELVKDLAPSS